MPWVYASYTPEHAHRRRKALSYCLTTLTLTLTLTMTLFVFWPSFRHNWGYVWRLITNDKTTTKALHHTTGGYTREGIRVVCRSVLALRPIQYLVGGCYFGMAGSKIWQKIYAHTAKYLYKFSQPVIFPHTTSQSEQPPPYPEGQYRPAVLLPASYCYCTLLETDRRRV